MYQKFETNKPRNETAQPRSQYIPTIVPPILLQHTVYKSLARFHSWEYINRILFAVCISLFDQVSPLSYFCQ
jgi:hypothetical protein